MINKEELQQLNKTISNYFYNADMIITYNLYTKLLDTLVYYENKVNELELEIEDLLDRDLI